MSKMFSDIKILKEGSNINRKELKNLINIADNLANLIRRLSNLYHRTNERIEVLNRILKRK